MAKIFLLLFESVKSTLLMALRVGMLLHAFVFSLNAINPKLYVEPEVKPYYEQFVKDCKFLYHSPKICDQSISMRFVNEPDQEYLGYALVVPIIGSKLKTIKINKYYWSKYDSDERWPIIYHELGHAILMRPHDDAFMKSPDGIIPRSLMHWQAFDSWISTKYEAYYLGELFK